ncbi:MAG: outer membrane beta-barrel protein [Nitrospinae bacterium]|nr:outer membrane beta-barrel protein [Nitrospinota bacterium]
MRPLLQLLLRGTLSLLGGVIVPTLAWAQPGFYVTPSLSLAAVYDDNLFSTPSGRGREQDIIMRFSPGIQAGYQSTPLTLLGRYTFDAEVFADHPDLTTPQARQRASMEVQYLPTRLLTLALTSEYVQTETPGELNLTTGLEGGRVRAQSYSFSPSVAYRFDPLTGGTGGYAFTKTEQSGGVTIDAHIATLGLERRITPRDTGDLGYTLRHFSFDDIGTTTSHAFTVGWARQITAQTSIVLRGGPRFSEGSVAPEVSAAIRHRLKTGELSFTYARTQTTAFGQAGTVITESFAGAMTYQLLRLLRVSAAPSYAINTSDVAEAKVYRAGLNATYQVNQWLSLLGFYQFSFQQGRLEAAAVTAGRGGEEIYHNIVLLSLTITYPFRAY